MRQTPCDGYVNTPYLTTLDVSNNPHLFSGQLRLLVCGNIMQCPSDVIGWEEMGMILGYHLSFFPQRPPLLGDINNDGYVDLEDVTLLARYLASHGVTLPNRAAALLTETSKTRGFPDLRDVLRLRRYLAGHGVQLEHYSP